MANRKYSWNVKTKQWEQTSGPPEIQWKSSSFKCPKCKKEFEQFGPKDRRTTSSPCCGTKSSKTLEMPQMMEKHKWAKTGKQSLDGGIPFGEVPGDEDYINIDSPLSPKP